MAERDMDSLTAKDAAKPTRSEKTLTTAGEGTWMTDTECGHTWLANWHRSAPLDKAWPRSPGRLTFSWVSGILGTTAALRTPRK